jgi:hypothetical protein
MMPSLRSRTSTIEEHVSTKGRFVDHIEEAERRHTYSLRPTAMITTTARKVLCNLDVMSVKEGMMSGGNAANPLVDHPNSEGWRTQRSSAGYTGPKECHHLAILSGLGHSREKLVLQIGGNSEFLQSTSVIRAIKALYSQNQFHRRAHRD